VCKLSANLYLKVQCSNTISEQKTDGLDIQRHNRPSDPHIHRKNSDNYSATTQQSSRQILFLSAAAHLRLADPRGPDDLGELPEGESSAQRLVQPAERGGEPPAASQPDPLLQERQRLRKSVQLGKAKPETARRGETVGVPSGREGR
jgi:hypothetical protein